MRMVLCAALGLLLLSNSGDRATAVPPAAIPLAGATIDGKLKAATNGMIRLEVKDLDPNAAVIWVVDPDPVDFEEVGDRAMFSGPDGEYAIRAIVLKLSAAGKTEKRTLSAKAVIGAGGPLPPGPTPKPPIPPGPTPPPVTPGKLMLVVFREASNATAVENIVITNQALNDYMRAKGHRWRILDKDVRDAAGQVPAEIAFYSKHSAGKTLPQLFVIDENRVVRTQVDFPATAADLLTLLPKLGG